MIFVNTKICDGCGVCLEACPTGALSLQNNLASIDQDLCQGCAACVEACPKGAILTEEIMPIEPENADLIPAADTAISVVSDQPQARSWREAIVSTLLWTGREIAPHLANLAVGFVEQRIQSVPTNQSHQSFRASGRRTKKQPRKGRQRRQRRRQRQIR